MMETVQFYNGREMPKVDLGTYRVENSDQCKDAVKHAIENGYRSIQPKYMVMKKWLVKG